MDKHLVPLSAQRSNIHVTNYSWEEQLSVSVLEELPDHTVARCHRRSCYIFPLASKASKLFPEIWNLQTCKIHSSPSSHSVVYYSYLPG